jgi:hypothetical protein
MLLAAPAVLVIIALRWYIHRTDAVILAEFEER